MGAPQTTIQDRRLLFELLVGLAIDRDSGLGRFRGLESLVLAQPHELCGDRVLGVRALEPAVAARTFAGHLEDGLGHHIEASVGEVNLWDPGVPGHVGRVAFNAWCDPETPVSGQFS
jgi:hypothetical protein